MPLATETNQETQEDTTVENCQMCGPEGTSRFRLLLLAYNAAHHDLLECAGPKAVRHSGEAGVFEVKFVGAQTKSTLTVEIVCDNDQLWLEPLDFRVAFRWPIRPGFSYRQESEEADVIRLMTCWLEQTSLSHTEAILQQIYVLSTARPAGQPPSLDDAVQTKLSAIDAAARASGRRVFYRDERACIIRYRDNR